MPNPGLSVDRLAWLAMRDYCEKQSRKGGAFGLLGRAFTTGRSRRLSASSSNFRNDISSDRMMDYSLAVDTCVQRLTAEERDILRSSGQLPSWFVAAVEQEREIERKRR